MCVLTHAFRQRNKRRAHPGAVICCGHDEYESDEVACPDTTLPPEK